MRFKLTILLLASALNMAAEPVTKFDNAKNAGECFEMQGATVFSSELIPVAQAKRYKLSGSFKNPLDVPVTLLFGITSFDVDKREIKVLSVSAVKGTDTVLAENCSPEDKIIKVKDASAWKTDCISSVVFETDPELKDLPNHNYTLSAIESINKKGDIWEIKLKSSCGRDYTEGTPVRQHSSGNTYVYTVISKMEPNGEWTKFEGIVNPSSKDSSSPFNVKNLRIGSAFIKITITCIPVQSCRLLFKDIDFSPSEGK